MTLPQLIEEGLSLVRTDPQHDLRLGFRCRLMAAIDGIPPRETGGNGRAKRVNIAKASVELVLPLWRTLLPNDTTPFHAFDIANALLLGSVSPAHAENEVGSLWSHCDDLAFQYDDDQAVIIVGYGAVQVVREALSERHFGCENVPDDGTDRDISPYDHDSFFCAAVAYSGGPTWDTSSSAQKRLEFWTWWLTSLLPSAALA